MKKLLLIGVWILLSCFQLFSQTQSKKLYDEFIPVSPNAASLGIYGAVPVSYYSGTVNVSIPIYEINLDGKKIPISLSYHTSGIKVAQEASSVGLGWSLNAGGAIVRETHGMDDFDRSPLSLGYYWDTGLPLTIEGDSYLRYKDYVDGIKDPEPDIFNFNFCGFSGSMLMGKVNTPGNSEKTGKAMIQNPDSYIDARYDFAGRRWIVYDNAGFAYYFSKTESSSGFSQTSTSLLGNSSREAIGTGGAINPYKMLTTAWYLDSIVSPKNNKVEFFYKAEQIYTPVTFTEDCSMMLEFLLNVLGSLGASYNFYNYSYSLIGQQVLDKITFNGNEITFHKSDRTDLEGASGKAKKIDRITVKPYNSSTFVKNVVLSYSYMGGATADPLNSRLMLQSVCDDNKSYVFDYYGGILPAKNSLETDFWGYYNAGKEDQFSKSDDRFYTISGFLAKTPTGKQIFYNGRNKTPNFSLTLIGSLNSIKYPTGAKSTFTYESHFFDTNVEFVGYSGYRDTVLARADYKSFEPYIDINNFKLDKATLCRFETQYFFELKGNWVGEADYVNVDILKKEANGSYSHTGIFAKSRPSDIVKGDGKIFNGRVEEARYFILPAGEYRILINRILSDYYKYFSTQGELRVIEEVKGSPTKSGAGLRIRKITNSDNNINEQRWFEYNTGKLLVTPLHHRRLNISIDEYLVIFTRMHFASDEAVYINGRTIPHNPMSRQMVGYSKVVEFVDDNKNTGYTEYKYHNEYDSISSFHQYMPGFPTFYNFLNGSLSEISVFDKNKKIIQNKKYTYLPKQKNSVPGFMIYKPPMGNNGCWGFYDRTIPKYTLDSEINTNYFDTNPVVETINYQYDPVYFMNMCTETTNSKGESTKTTLNYPSDYNDNISKKMVEKGMINYPFYTLTYTNGIESSRSKNNYNLFGDLILPSSVQTSTTAQPGLRENITFNQYDSKGNLLQYTGLDGIPVSFIWGYNNQYPVAKIVGASYADVKSKITAPDLSNIEKGTLNDDQTRTVLNKIRTTYATNKSVQVSTYTYAPLIGMTSETDPNGITTYYEYDSFGRLIQVRDNNNNILKQYQYNYKK